MKKRSRLYLGWRTWSPILRRVTSSAIERQIDAAKNEDLKDDEEQA